MSDKQTVHKHYHLWPDDPAGNWSCSFAVVAGCFCAAAVLIVRAIYG